MKLTVLKILLQFTFVQFLSLHKMNVHYQHIYNNIKTWLYKIFMLTQNDIVPLLIGFQSTLFCLIRTHHVHVICNTYY